MNAQFLPPIKRYMNAVERHLHLPQKIKVRVMSDLMTTVNSRREQGETLEQIMADLGTPRQVAERFNEELKEFAVNKSPWRWLCLAGAVAAAGILLWLLFLNGWLLEESSSMGVIGGADGPTAIFVTTKAGWGSNMMMAALLLSQICAFLCGYWILGRTVHKKRVLWTAIVGLMLQVGSVACLVVPALLRLTPGIHVLLPATLAWQGIQLCLLPGFWLNITAIVWAAWQIKKQGKGGDGT